MATRLKTLFLYKIEMNLNKLNKPLLHH